MKRMVKFAFLLAAIAAIAAGGYRLGAGSWPDRTTVLAIINGHEPSETARDRAVAGGKSTIERRVLYWRHPDGKPEYSATSVKTTDGREYLPVYEDEEPALAGDKPSGPAKAATGDTKAAGGERKVLYYRNPMGLPDTSPVPKKDSMNMDYIPVYEDEEDDGSTVKVSIAKMQRAGVRTEAAEERSIVRHLRAPGVAKPDERTLRTVTVRADGYVEKLYVNALGQHVKAGEPLFRFYSPAIISAQIDYKNRTTAASPLSHADVELYAKVVAERFRKLGVPEQEIKRLRTTGSISESFDVPSPADGIVMEKNVIEGQMAKAGEELYRLVDLKSIWVNTDVPEQDIALIKIGAPAKVTFRAFPNEPLEGRVDFVLHELNMNARTAKVRVEVKNPEHRIKHEMFADVEIDTATGEAPRVAVPASAVIDSGTRQIVLIERGEGRFEPRPVKVGLRGDAYVEITDGVKVGEKVVVAANFLIDAESNLKAALKTFEPDTPSAEAEPSTGASTSAEAQR